MVSPPPACVAPGTSRRRSKMKSIVMAAALAAGIAAAGVANAQEALAKSSGCMTCHAVDTKKMGPSFKDTAAKFKGKPDAEGRWSRTEGREGPPAVKTSDADGHAREVDPRHVARRLRARLGAGTGRARGSSRGAVNPATRPCVRMRHAAPGVRRQCDPPGHRRPGTIERGATKMKSIVIAAVVAAGWRPPARRARRRRWRRAAAA